MPEIPFGNDTNKNPVGENPSQRLIGAGLTEIASPLIGIAVIGMSIRQPVADVESAVAYAIDGHGNKQP